MSGGFEIQTYKIYVLYLENEKYYVGITKDLPNRFAEHKLRMGAAWTTKNKVIGIVYTKDLRTANKADAEKKENDLTKELMKCFGIDDVRGGDFCRVSDALTRKSLGKKFVDSNYNPHMKTVIAKKIDAIVRDYKAGYIAFDKGSGQSVILSNNAESASTKKKKKKRKKTSQIKQEPNVKAKSNKWMKDDVSSNRLLKQGVKPLNKSELARIDLLIVNNEKYIPKNANKRLLKIEFLDGTYRHVEVFKYGKKAYFNEKKYSKKLSPLVASAFDYRVKYQSNLLELIQNEPIAFDGKEKEDMLKYIKNESIIIEGKEKEKPNLHFINNEPIELKGEDKNKNLDTINNEPIILDGENVKIKSKKKKMKDAETTTDKDINNNLVHNDNDQFTYDAVKPEKKDNKDLQLEKQKSLNIKQEPLSLMV